MTSASPPSGTILRNAGWLTAGRLVGDFLAFVLFIVISRHFGPAGMGEFAYGFAVAAFVYSLTMLGLDEYGVRELARLPDEDRGAFFGRLIGTQLAVLVPVLAGLGAFLALSAPSPATGRVVLLLTVHQVSLALARLLLVPALANQAMAAPAVAEMTCRMAGMVLTAALVLRGHASLEVALVGFPLSGIALLIVAVAISSRHIRRPRLKLAPREWARTIRAAWAFGASDLVYLLYARFDLLLLSGMRGEADAGIYASGLKFLEVGVMPIFYIGVASFPALSRLAHRRSEEFPRAATGVLAASAVMAFLVAWGMFYLAPPFLISMLGHRFDAARDVLRMMAVLVFLTGIESGLMRIFMATDLQVRMLKLQFAGTLLNVVLNLVLIPRFGITGAVAASGCMLVTIDVLYVITLRRDRLAAAPLARLLLLFAMLLVAAGLAGALAARLSSSLWVPPLVAFLIGPAVALGVALRLTSAAAGSSIGTSSLLANK